MSSGGGEEDGSRMLLSSHSCSPVELQKEKKMQGGGQREEEKGRSYLISEGKPSEPKSETSETTPTALLSCFDVVFEIEKPVLLIDVSS